MRKDRSAWGAGMDAMQGSLGWRWRDLPAENRRWLILNTVVGAAIVNVIANGGFAWLSVKSGHTVPLWAKPRFGHTSTIMDTVGTFFFLPFFTTMAVTRGVNQQIRSGRLTPIGTGSSRRSLIGRLPAVRWRRSLALGALCAVVLSPVAIPILFGFDFAGVSRHSFVLYKVVLGVALGLIVTPTVAILAMTKPT